jgi:glycosyltransferase involved in cell wall biosynthesis
METEPRSRGVPCIVEDVLSCATSGNRLTRAGVSAPLALKIGNKRFQVIHAQNPISYRVPSVIARFTAARRLCHLHFPPSDVRKELEWAFRVKPHMVVACSQSVADGYAPGLQGMFSDAAVRVLVNFADTERFSPGPRAARLVEELGLANASHVVTICGQVSERKGHPDFLRMAQRVLRALRGPDLIAGERTC